MAETDEENAVAAANAFESEITTQHAGRGVAYICADCTDKLC